MRIVLVGKFDSRITQIYWNRNRITQANLLSTTRSQMLGKRRFNRFSPKYTRNSLIYNKMAIQEKRLNLRLPRGGPNVPNARMNKVALSIFFTLGDGTSFLKLLRVYGITFRFGRGGRDAGQGARRGERPKCRVACYTNEGQRCNAPVCRETNREVISRAHS